MPTGDTKVDISVDVTPTGSPPVPEPEYHLTFVDSTLPPISLFRQILERLREPKSTVPKEYYRGKGTMDGAPSGNPAEPGPEFHATFVDTTLPPVSLFRQIWQGFHEPKFTVPQKYYQGKGAGEATAAGSSAAPRAEFHPTFVESSLPPVSLFRQVLQELHEPKFKVPEKYLQEKTSLPAADLPPPVWEDPNQLALPFEKLKGPVPISSWRTSVPEPEYHLVMVVDPEAIRWRRRTMYLSSVILHGLLVLILVFSPDLLRRGKQMMGFPVEVSPRKQYSFLLLPPEVLRRLREPPPENSPLSDRDRRAQGRSPIIVPRGLPMPYSRGNTPLPEIAGGKPPAAAPTPPPAGGNAAAGGPPSNQPSNASPGEANNAGGLRLEDVKPNAGGGGSGLNLPNLTPGQAIQQSLQSAARAGRYSRGSGSGNGAGYGDGNAEFSNLEPNFSTEGPIILSDTRGVDFGPYLARIVYIVRRNWYSVIPESARLGEKGRVGIVFEILKDGTVPQLRLVASSGSDALDRAALAGIRASIPFPPLPQEFTGNHLVLQFIFLYNMTLGQ
jgi:TonB family protein